MLLAVDIGNTNITLGIFRVSKGKILPKPIKVWRLNTNKTESADKYGRKILDLFDHNNINSADIKAVAIASVVPVLDPIFEDVSFKYLGRKAFFVDEKTSFIKMKYENLNEIGADRIADAVAAYHFYGGPAIVIDFGTATTFDCIDKNGVYLGGVIAPGPLISAEALAKKTSKLPQVEVVKPKRAIGKSTVKGIQSGLYFGYVGLVKEILKRIRSEMDGNPKILATGGLADLIVPEIKEVKKILPDLTLEGIRLVYQNSK
ncbi:MAG: type III pantothenate kinase [Elusimicrobia bacterium]|nr:type III pantothenate kinase [Elusimicrobiota bacterium]